MRSHSQAIVIGGGVVGASVLYHLAKLGWTETLLIERKELTAGSTWHAAAGFHAINGDPTMAALQAYTIKLYKEIEEASGQPTGIHMPGGISLAGTPERWEFLRATWARNRMLGLESELLTPEEVKKLAPIVDTSTVIGGLYDPDEGHLDPYGTTHAYAKGARAKGAQISLNNRVLELHRRPEGGWSVVTEKGTVTCDHLVNAGGLWADRVGRMAGLELPVAALEHHYLITETIPEIAAMDHELPMVVDLEGYTYARQEHQGLLLGVYELNPKHWNVDGVPWEFGLELIPEDIDRIESELAVGFARYPCLETAGIKKWVNGAFTFTPDGNPLVGPVPGMPDFWCACGVMAGFSQGGGVGLALAEWMVAGEPGRDVAALDVARYGDYASRPYVLERTAEFYAKRFVLSYPNEVWPAGRAHKTSPLYAAQKAANGVFGVSDGLEIPLWFQTPGEEPVEEPSFRRSNAFDRVADEVAAVRERVGMVDAQSFSRYRIEGPNAEAFLNRILASKLPKVGKGGLAPALTSDGRLMGDLTVHRLGEDRFWVFGSGYLQRFHPRWFAQHAPADGVTIENLTDSWGGIAVAGPESRTLLQPLTDLDLDGKAFRFMSVTQTAVANVPCLLARLSVTGELGYELYAPANLVHRLYSALHEAGKALGLKEIGYSAVNSLRLEKAYGIWSREFTPDYKPHQNGFDRFVAYDREGFIGREAALADRDDPKGRVLVPLTIDAESDGFGFEPVWSDGKIVGYTTSAGYGHHVKRSLALAYIDRDLPPDAPLTVSIIGEEKPAQRLSGPAYDPSGSRMRG